MKIVIAPDKFKGCLSAVDVARAIADGCRRAAADMQVIEIPMADGGEGIVTALVNSTRGTLHCARVTGPLPHTKVNATFGMLGDKTTAVIEMSAASGLALLSTDERDPMNTTTFGTGELIVAAKKLGAKKIILGIGGSATIDAGIGCAQATGHTIVLQNGEPVSHSEPLTGADISRVVLIKQHRGEITDGMEIIVACDVSNPLCGPTGSAEIFGRQKGATDSQVKQFDLALMNLAARHGHEELANIPGAGAAGGLGYGMLAFYSAQLKSGIELVIDALSLRKHLKDADLCITAEGKIDGQSRFGKTTVGVARLCKEMKIPCIAIAGTVGDDIASIHEEGIAGCFSICNQPMQLADAMEHASALITAISANISRAFIATRKQA